MRHGHRAAAPRPRKGEEAENLNRFGSTCDHDAQPMPPEGCCGACRRRSPEGCGAGCPFVRRRRKPARPNRPIQEPLVQLGRSGRRAPNLPRKGSHSLTVRQPVSNPSPPETIIGRRLSGRPGGHLRSCFRTQNRMPANPWPFEGGRRFLLHSPTRRGPRSPTAAGGAPPLVRSHDAPPGAAHQFVQKAAGPARAATRSGRRRGPVGQRAPRGVTGRTRPRAMSAPEDFNSPRGVTGAPGGLFHGPPGTLEKPENPARCFIVFLGSFFLYTYKAYCLIPSLRVSSKTRSKNQ